MAYYSTVSRDYKTLLSITLDELLGSGMPEDNVYENDPTLSMMRSSGNVKVIEGGDRIRIPIMTEEGGTFAWYSGLENLNITPSEGSTTAWFTWKQAATSVALSGLEARKNSGKAEIADIVKVRYGQAEADMATGVATGLFSDGTGSANKQLTGFEAAMETTPGSASYASIPVANTVWRNVAVASVGSAATNLISNLRTTFNSCSKGRSATSAPNLIVTTQTVHEAFEAQFAPRVRFQPNPSEGADAGIDKIKFKGADVIWDPFCTSGTMYVLNLAHIMLFVHRAANFTQSEEGFQKPIDQDGLVSQIFFQGNVAVNNRPKLGKMAGIT